MEFLDGNSIYSQSIVSGLEESYSDLEEECLFCDQEVGADFPEMIKKALFTKYSSSQNYFFTQDINDLLQQRTTQFTINFQQQQIWDDNEQYLRRQYKSNEWNGKITNLSQYYKYHIDVPRIYSKYICHIFNQYYQNKRQLDYKRLKKILKEDSFSSESEKQTKNSYSQILEELRHSIMENQKRKNQKRKEKSKKEKVQKKLKTDQSTLIADLMLRLNQITKLQQQQNLSFSLSNIQFSKNYISGTNHQKQIVSHRDKKPKPLKKQEFQIDGIFKKKKINLNQMRGMPAPKNKLVIKKDKKTQGVQAKNLESLRSNELHTISKQLSNRLTDQIFNSRKIPSSKRFFQKKKKQQQQKKGVICNAKINIHINNALFLTNSKNKDKDPNHQVKGCIPVKNEISNIKRPSFNNSKNLSKEKRSLNINRKKEISLQKIYVQKKKTKPNSPINRKQSLIKTVNKFDKKSIQKGDKYGDFRIISKRDQFSDSRIIKKQKQRQKNLIKGNMQQKSKSVTSVKEKIGLRNLSNKQGSLSVKKHLNQQQLFKQYISHQIPSLSGNKYQQGQLYKNKKVQQLLQKKLGLIQRSSIYSKLKHL